MEYIKKPNLFFIYDAKAEVQKRICSGQFTIVDDDFATLGFKCGVDYVMDIINEAEVEDVAPVVHASFIFDKTNLRFLCTNCETEPPSFYTAETVKTFNYCPNCGARIDGNGEG